MARPLRIERAGAWYHLTARGNERQAIFRAPRDYQHFCELLAEAVERFGWRLHAYVLMKNHFHLMVETPKPNLSRGMQWLGVSYTVWFNRRHQRTGHLFQGRFKSILVDPAAWAVELSRYVHLNPVRVAALGLSKADRAQDRTPAARAPEPDLVRRRLEILRQFRWSSYGAYVGQTAPPPWLSCQTILDRMGQGNLVHRQRRYRQSVEASVRQGLPETPWEQLRARLVLGSDKFLRKIQATLSGDKREQPSLRRLATRPDWAAVVAAVEEAKGRRWEDFAEQRGDWGRDMALYLGRRHCDLKLAQLGTLAGGLDYAAVSIAIHRFQHRLGRDKSLARQVEKASKTLFNV